MVAESVAGLVSITGVGPLAIECVGEPRQQAEKFGWPTEYGEAVRAFEASERQPEADQGESSEGLAQQSFLTESATVVFTGPGNTAPREGSVCRWYARNLLPFAAAATNICDRSAVKSGAGSEKTAAMAESWILTGDSAALMPVGRPQRVVWQLIYCSVASPGPWCGFAGE